MEIRVKKGKYNFTVKGDPIPKEMFSILNSMFSAGDFVFLDCWDCNNDFVSEQKIKYRAILPGQRIREARKSARMTQKELAKKLDTNEQYVSNLENGSKSIGRKMAIKLGDIFKIEPSEFLTVETKTK